MAKSRQKKVGARSPQLDLFGSQGNESAGSESTPNPGGAIAKGSRLQNHGEVGNGPVPAFSGKAKSCGDRPLDPVGPTPQTGVDGMAQGGTANAGDEPVDTGASTFSPAEARGDSMHSDPSPKRPGPPAGTYMTGMPYELPCMRCKEPFVFDWNGYHDLICPTCTGGEPSAPLEAAESDAPWDDRCMVIGCVQIGLERPQAVLAGGKTYKPQLCGEHDCKRVHDILATGAYPGEFWYLNKKIVLPTVRRLEDGSRGEPQAGGLFKEKP